LFEFENTTVPEVAVCVPAAIAPGVTGAPIEIVLPFVEIETAPVAERLDVAGADTWMELFE